MPRKIRELMRDVEQAGFTGKQTGGSRTGPFFD